MDVYKRLLQHQTDLLKGRHCNMQLQRCYNKHGEIFKYFLVEETKFERRSDLLAYEQKFIDNNVNGYNMAPANGGDILSKHPDKVEIRARIVESHKKLLDNMTVNERKKKFGKSKELNSNWRGGGVSKKYCPTCNVNQISVKSAVCSNCRDRTIDKNPFYGKHHSEETKAVLREKMSGENSWIKGIDASKLPYTKQYLIEYPNGESKMVHGLKIVAEEFGTTIPNLHAAIERMSRGAIPTRGVLKGMKITAVVSQ